MNFLIILTLLTAAPDGFNTSHATSPEDRDIAWSRVHRFAVLQLGQIPYPEQSCGCEADTQQLGLIGNTVTMGAKTHSEADE